MKLRWTNTDLAKGFHGELYSIWTEVLPKPGCNYLLTIWKDNQWRTVCESKGSSKRDVKALAQQIEDGKREATFESYPA